MSRGSSPNEQADDKSRAAGEDSLAPDVDVERAQAFADADDMAVGMLGHVAQEEARRLQRYRPGALLKYTRHDFGGRSYRMPANCEPH